MFNFDNSYMDLPQIFYRRQNPAPVAMPRVVVFNEGLAHGLGLDSMLLRGDGWLLSGDIIPKNARPISQAYAGFQFGHFNMLGDGRAVLLGEHITPDGRRFDVQLKGAGTTDYSRRGDGLAAIGPMLREYIISEYMAAVGIPTTRALAVTLTGGLVYRERALAGAVLARVASSHIRVGTFDFARVYGTFEDLKDLADYTVCRHFPWLQKEHESKKYLLLLRETAKAQAALIARWMLVGFVHGVMNTDNMAISGETIDYGPCAFMDEYNPQTVFSSIDEGGRYAYQNQPHAGAWNLARFAEALLPLIDKDEETAIRLSEKEIEGFWRHYNKNWLDGMRGKMGLSGHDDRDAPLAAELLDLMAQNNLDYTNTFLNLTNTPELSGWLEKWRMRAGSDYAEIMQKNNPAVIPRNHHVEGALAAAEAGDYAPLQRLTQALQKPFEYSEEYTASPQSCGKYTTFCGT
ncbi:MAG: YdiU family protein [Defluviitaleaceae bacterium]|nr:YdiU family protein [Defluviitaleaceae bacterium]